MPPSSSARSRRNSGARAGASPTSRRRVSRTSTWRAPPPRNLRNSSGRNSGSRADDMDFRAWRRRLREYDEITNVGPIIRRYFVIGAFDGALTVLGIIIGSSAFGDLESHKGLVVSASFGAAIVSALVHGVAPLIAALLPVIPFLLLDARTATIAAIVITLVILFVLGVYLGNLVRERVVVTGLRFAAAGIGTALILWFLGARLA